MDVPVTVSIVVAVQYGELRVGASVLPETKTPVEALETQLPVANALAVILDPVVSERELMVQEPDPSAVAVPI